MSRRQLALLPLASLLLQVTTLAFHPLITPSHRPSSLIPQHWTTPTPLTATSSVSTDHNELSVENNGPQQEQLAITQTRHFLETTLLPNLHHALDRYVVLFHAVPKLKALQLLQEIDQITSRHSVLAEIAEKARIRAHQAGVIQSVSAEIVLDEETVKSSSPHTAVSTSQITSNVRSALSQRSESMSKPDILFSQVDSKLAMEFSMTKKATAPSAASTARRPTLETTTTGDLSTAQQQQHLVVSSTLAQSLSTWNSTTSQHIAGLDDILHTLQRRVGTPLAAPPELLHQLGVQPVRGVLLYGPPGCGKTLVARTVGELLSPMRPVTMVAGPELMDKYVGSSEKNLRNLLDNPPAVYQEYENVSDAALHVIGT